MPSTLGIGRRGAIGYCLQMRISFFIGSACKWPSPMRKTRAWTISSWHPQWRSPAFGNPSWSAASACCFGLLFRPWAARNPRSRAFVGIGAFNLVRRSVYEAIGTHRAIANAVVDDLQLGALIKARGFRQAAVLGRDLLSVRWQVGLRGIVRGLEKNAFAGLHFSVLYAAAGCGALLLAGLAPMLAGAAPVAGHLWAGAALAGIACQAYHAREARLRPWSALFQPFGFLVLAYAVARSAHLARVRGRIEWRDTSYPLAVLRRPAPPDASPAYVDSADTTR
jgi:hypothetical protein